MAKNDKRPASNEVQHAVNSAAYYQPRKLRFEDMDPRGMKSPPAHMAKVRRAWLDNIQEKMTGFIQAGQTYRRALLYRWTKAEREKRAADRAAILAEYEEYYQDEKK